MTSTLKEVAGESLRDVFERQERALRGEISERDFRAAQKALNDRVNLSNEKLVAIGNSFLSEDKTSSF